MNLFFGLEARPGPLSSLGSYVGGYTGGIPVGLDG